jgi:hypothetical protein
VLKNKGNGHNMLIEHSRGAYEVGTGGNLNNEERREEQENKCF